MYATSQNNDWDGWATFAAFVYITPHFVTKFTPYQLFGRIWNLPGTFQKTPQPLHNFEDYFLELKLKLQHCNQIANKHLIETKEKQRDTIRHNSVEFNEGGLVLLKREFRHKLDGRYTGSY